VCKAATPLAAAGAACGHGDCAAGLFCDHAVGAAAVCKPQLGAGVTCTSDGECQAGLECAGPAGARKCVAYAGDGQPCGTNAPGCDNEASYCDPVERSCKPRLKLGAACTIEGSGLFTVSPCVPYATCVNGVCTARVMPGQACGSSGSTTQPNCMIGSCQDGVCTVDAPEPSCYAGSGAGTG
jgi:hypothetical protein